MPLDAAAPSSDPAVDRQENSPSGVFPPAETAGRWPDLAKMERDHILRTLEQTTYNQTVAARLLNIPRKQLARKIKTYQIDASLPPRAARQVSARVRATRIAAVACCISR